MTFANPRRSALAQQILAIGTILALATCSLTACGQDAANSLNRLLAMKPPYPDTSWSLIYAIHKMRPPDDIYWLDNDRILFPGYEKQGDSLPFVIILNTRTGQYTKEAPLRQHFWMCFNRGFLAYNISEDEHGFAKTMMAGPLGQVKLLASPSPGQQEPELKQCHGWPNDDLTEQRPNANVRNLSPEDGYLLIEDHSRTHSMRIENPEAPVQLFKPGKAPIDLPIQKKEVDSSRVTYSEFAGLYLIVPELPRSGTYGVVTWPLDLPIPVYTISHDGDVKAIELPAGSQPAGVYLTRKGLIWVSNATHGNSRDAGAWLLIDGKAQKIIEHFVTGIGISPDGCKVAYSVNSWDPQKTDNLHLMNLCQD